MVAEIRLGQTQPASEHTVKEAIDAVMNEGTCLRVCGNLITCPAFSRSPDLLCSLLGTMISGVSYDAQADEANVACIFIFSQLA
jgi:hypothetical protein